MATEHSSKSDICSNDTFSILLATDCHLGYEETTKRASQQNDSFITFEEILQYGKRHRVDFVLLGGDLFHDAKPSQKAMTKCTELLRKYSLGDGDINIQFLTDPDVIFQHCSFKFVNYEDPDINVCMPVFSIHGNHDDPNYGGMGVMDLLAASGLVNYFGKCTELDNITIIPLVLKKGHSKIAIYGLSYINDRRLCRLLKDGKVNLVRTEETQDCFNILVLHQNRNPYDSKSYIPQSKLPNFIHLIIWGHEHECRIKPEFSEEGGYYICQPGSSVATSLCQAEAVKKHIGILNINKTRFTVKRLQLHTVRPFVFDDLILHDCEDLMKEHDVLSPDIISDYVDKHIEHKLMAEAAKQLTNHPQQPTLPLIRLRVFYRTDNELFDQSRLVQKYCDEVCNANDMLLFRKERPLTDKSVSKTMRSNNSNDAGLMSEVFGRLEDQEEWCESVQSGLKRFFDSEEHKDSLTLFLPSEMNDTLTKFVEKSDVDSFKELLRYRQMKTVEYLKKQNIEPSAKSIQEALVKLRDARRSQEEAEQADIHRMLTKTPRTNVTTVAVEDQADSDVCVLDGDSDRNAKKLKVGSSDSREKGTAKNRKQKKDKDTTTADTSTTESKTKNTKLSAFSKKHTNPQSHSTERPSITPGRGTKRNSGKVAEFGQAARQVNPAMCTFIDASDSDSD